MAKLQGINHVVLKVRNLDRSAEFYETVLGFVRAGSRPGMLFLTGGAHAHDLALLEVGDSAPLPHPSAVGLFHFCVTVADEADLRELYKACRQKGARILGTVDHVISRSFYLEDPDGITVEVTFDTPKSEWEALPDPFCSDRRYSLD